MKAGQFCRVLALISVILGWQGKRSMAQEFIPTPHSGDIIGAGAVANTLDSSIGEMINLISNSKAQVDQAVGPRNYYPRLDLVLRPAASGRAPAVVDEENLINPTGNNINDTMAPKVNIDEKGSVIRFSTTGKPTAGQ